MIQKNRFAMAGGVDKFLVLVIGDRIAIDIKILHINDPGRNF